MNYYKHHIGDYRRDTSHLSLLEHGIYRQLLDQYYLDEHPLPAETESVIRRLSARTDEEKKAVETVLKEFFIFENGWKHRRCEAELRDYQAFAEQARINGTLGGRPRKTQSVSENNPTLTEMKPNRKLTNNHKPITNNQEETLMSGKPDVSPIRLVNGAATEAAKRILDFLNQKTGRAYRAVPANIGIIVSRLKEGATEQDCKSVIARKVRQWSTDEKMNQYLRPETLFGARKFAGYVGELVEAPDAYMP